MRSSINILWKASNKWVLALMNIKSVMSMKSNKTPHPSHRPDSEMQDPLGQIKKQSNVYVFSTGTDPGLGKCLKKSTQWPSMSGHPPKGCHFLFHIQWTPSACIGPERVVKGSHWEWLATELEGEKEWWERQTGNHMALQWLEKVRKQTADTSFQFN